MLVTLPSSLESRASLYVLLSCLEMSDPKINEPRDEPAWVQSRAAQADGMHTSIQGCRGTSPMKKRIHLGPCSGPLPRVLGGS
jgi:hypothetical protein